MKTSILVLFASAFLICINLISCESPEQKLENAQNEVKEANEDLDKANAEQAADMEKYRKETADRIAVNEKSIAEFKARKEADKNDAKADYNKEISELENKNSDMKKRLDDYKMEGREKWEQFKTEFNHDMDELGKAFSDLTVTNTK